MAVSALKVEAVFWNVIEDPFPPAVSVTVPEMLSLLAAVMPSTVILPALDPPIFRFAAVMFWISAPASSSVSATLSPPPPGSPTSTASPAVVEASVTVWPVAVIVPVISISSAV